MPRRARRGPRAAKSKPAALGGGRDRAAHAPAPDHGESAAVRSRRLCCRRCRVDPVPVPSSRYQTALVRFRCLGASVRMVHARLRSRPCPIIDDTDSLASARGYHRRAMPIYEFECEHCGESLRGAGAGRDRARRSAANCGAEETSAALLGAGAARSSWSRPPARPVSRRSATTKLHAAPRAQFKARRQKAREARSGRAADRVPEAAERRERLVEVYREASVCTQVPACETRTNVVFGAGNADADLMFVGEAPGAEEDRQGLPFVGRAGGCSTSCSRGSGWHARTFDHERAQVPAARQPRPAARRDRVLPAVPVPAGRADPAAGDRDARQLRDEAADRQPDRDHQGARHAAGARDRRPHRVPDAAAPPGGGAAHARRSSRPCARTSRSSRSCSRRDPAAPAPADDRPRCEARRRAAGGGLRPTSSTCSVEPSGTTLQSRRDRGARRTGRRRARARRRGAGQR